MRFWPSSASALEARAQPVAFGDLVVQIEEGYLVALSALRLSVKNAIILRILRDEVAWTEPAAVDLARQAIDTLSSELGDNAARLSGDSLGAAPTARESRAARSRRDLARVQRQRDEANRLTARGRVLRGVVESLKKARDDEEFVLQLALRARDDTLAELMQARLIPRVRPQLLSEEEQRTAIDGVKADLQLLIDERGGYSVADV